MTDASPVREFDTVPDYSDHASTFGDRLTHAREALGLEQSELAHQMGVRLETVQDWEEDRSEPRANRLQMLSGMLSVPIIWLLSGQGQPPSLPDDMAKSSADDCIAELRSLREEHKRQGEKLTRLEKRLRSVLG